MSNVYDLIASEYQQERNQKFYRRIAGGLCNFVINNFGQEFHAILDLGCGSGISTQILAENFKNSLIYAVDSSEKMLEKCAGSIISDRIIFQKSSAEELSFNGKKISLIFGSMCYHWLEKSAVERLVKSLSPGGVAAFSIPMRSPKKLLAGNRILARLLSKFNGTNDFRYGLTLDEIDKEFSYLKPVYKEIIAFEEKFKNLDDLFCVLNSRGAVDSLFGENKTEAQAFASELFNGKPVSLGWEICLAAGKGRNS